MLHDLKVKWTLSALSETWMFQFLLDQVGLCCFFNIYGFYVWIAQEKLN